jgi:two-component system NarL family response regulator
MADVGAPRIRILCTDDHRIVREGISLIIEQEPDMTVVALAATVGESVAAFTEHRPDIVIMDLRLGQNERGVDAIRAIREIDADARIIVLTMYQGEEDVYRSIEAGAATYLLKDTLADDLIRTIRDVHQGQPPRLSPQVEARLAERAARPSLTPRELEVLTLMSRGLRNKEIATSLGVSAVTAQVHVKNILNKLKVNDRTSAVHVGILRGIIHIG